MSLQEIPIEHIYVSETASQSARRKHFGKEELEDLISSIATHGVLQPIIVRPRPAAGGYTHELVAGERRFLAAEEAGLEKIPAMVRELADEQVLEVQLIENLQRKDLHPMQEAEGYQELMTKHGHPVEELHDRVGKSRSYVYGRLKLLALCKQAREAFYDDRISASVALLIARIPGHKLQEQALKDLIDPDGQLGYRAAKKIVQETYMLRLKGAPFPVDDPDLHRQAGPCNNCPKRTGNQPELFGDIESADVCTDPVCFNVKRKEHGERLIKAAKADGRDVLAGAAAKKVMPYNNNSYLDGYTRLDATCYADARNRKVRSVIGSDADVTLLQVPNTGEVVEVVKHSVLNAALKKAQPRRQETRRDDGTAARQKKAKLERKFREALYERIRPKLKAPTLQQMAQAIFDRLEYDTIKTLCSVRGYEPPKVKQTYGPATRDHRAVGKGIASMSDETAALFINDCIYARELQVSTWSNTKPERLLAAAADAGVDVKAVRKEVTPKPKKKAAKKKAAKKAARKKVPAVNCLHCGKPLTGKRPGSKYCDNLHEKLAKESRRKKGKAKKKALKKASTA